MNQFFFYGLLLSICVLAACDNQGKNPPALTTGEMTVVDESNYQPLYVHPVLAESELNAQNTALGGYGQLLPPPMERQIAQILTRSYWVFEFYHDSNATIPQRKRGAGQWFRFNPDGTFTGGHWGRQTHAGLWYLLFDGDKTFLTVDSNVDRLDAKWDIQAVSGESDAMGWVRTDEFGPRTPAGIQGKLIELYDMPTKAQFGVQE